MYDDVRLHVARSYTSSADSPFSLILPLTPSNHLLLGLFPPMYFHFHRSPPYIVIISSHPMLMPLQPPIKIMVKIKFLKQHFETNDDVSNRFYWPFVSKFGTQTRTYTHTHSHTNKLPTAGVQLVGHTSIIYIFIPFRLQSLRSSRRSTRSWYLRTHNNCRPTPRARPSTPTRQTTHQRARTAQVRRPAPVEQRDQRQQVALVYVRRSAVDKPVDRSLREKQQTWSDSDPPQRQHFQLYICHFNATRHPQYTPRTGGMFYPVHTGFYRRLVTGTCSVFRRLTDGQTRYLHDEVCMRTIVCCVCRGLF